MRYGFVIDQDRCIGCHACTVACKEEHQVPLGVFRTWVKCVEKGEFPHTNRHFGVMRCNHCDSAPCIEICPTKALYRRDDGIVDFDNRRCIGCKSCMQACPYDALYIDPANNTAAKCNFCAHRIEASLQPACVIVCPTQAILAGNLDDPGSNVSQAAATEKVVVRKPQKGTHPKVFYVGIEGALLDPSRLLRQNTYAWAEQRKDSITQAGFDSALTREIYDVAHLVPWGWKIAAYLWAKSIAAGVLLTAAILLSRSRSPSRLFTVISPVIALCGLAATALLLIFDLKRPDRFLYLLTKPNFRSWLVLGGYILMLYGLMGSAWLATGLLTGREPSALTWSAAALSIGTACYSAFLFAQAKGRDLWRSPLFLWHLLVQAFIGGSGTLLIASVASDAAPETVRQTSIILLASLAVSLVMTLTEVVLPHVSEDARLAVFSMVKGRYRHRFWRLSVAAGLLIPIGLMIAFLLSAIPAGFALAGALLALAGLFWFEELWIKAGQYAPLS